MTTEVISYETTDYPDRFLRLSAVLDRVGLSRATIYRKIRDGSFPKQVAISANGVGWRESDIMRWMIDPCAFQEQQ